MKAAEVSVEVVEVLKPWMPIKRETNEKQFPLRVSRCASTRNLA